MSKSQGRTTWFWLGLIALTGLLLAQSKPAAAGIFNADQEVTYKVYWVNHKEFTGGCNSDGTHTAPNGNSWYLEAGTLQKCPKVLKFNLPDDFSNAIKVEIYLDLWRNYTSKVATFKLNDGPTIYNPPVGFDFSRTPYIGEVNKSELKVGENTMTVWAQRPGHIHDIAFLIYYDDNNPLLPGSGSDVTAPTGSLTSIEADNGTFAPSDTGTLMVNSDKLKLTANVSGDAKYVEFHAWYEGYDLDNDGNFREWQNLSRNNWWPGGVPANQVPANGGTINHIGTVVPSGGVATVTWNLPHVTNQARIKFKIRIVDNAGNAREVPASGQFKLMRSRAVTSFIIHDFVDVGLNMGGSSATSRTYKFPVPSSAGDFSPVYLVGNYWGFPRFSINGGSEELTNSTEWFLGVKQITSNSNKLNPGVENTITYSHRGNSFGMFVERPGPLFVMRHKNATTTDTDAPFVSRQRPLPNATNVDVKSTIVAHVGDLIFGVDWTTLKMTVNGVDVTGQVVLRGVMGDYRLTYDPPGNMPFSTPMNVVIEACDLVGNCMTPVSYQFTTAAPDTTPPIISNATAAPLAVAAIIKWTTNEPATSMVDYGLTNGYELGTVEDTVLKTSHQLQIKNLQPNTTYQFRIRSTDEQNNTGTLANQSFITSSGQVYSDDFNACTLNDALWEIVNPKNDLIVEKLGFETLSVTAPAGSAYNWATDGPPRLMQPTTDSNFEIEISFDTSVAIAQSQGVFIEEGTGNFLRIGFERTNAQGPIIFARYVKDGATVKDSTVKISDPPPSPLKLRVKREGTTFSWRYWDGATWKNAATMTSEVKVLRLGFYVGSVASGGTPPPGHTAVVDYFFNTSSPIQPEDGKTLSVNVNKVGQGNIEKIPDQPTYSCGDQVALSATPDIGWNFTGWSGDVAGSNTTIAFEIDGPKNVTATFTPEQYDLTIAIVGPGGAANQVLKNPSKETYTYGDQVELTAVPAPGIFFGGWGGDLSGATNPINVNITGDMYVVANFTNNPPPIVTPIDDKSVKLGEQVSFQVTAVDSPGETLTLTAENLPVGATFVDNGDGTGDFSWQPDLSQIGDHTITFTASDGIGQGSASMTISVTGYVLVLPAVLGE